MSVQFLEKNPFFVLEISPTCKRSVIISKVEEKAFFLEESFCNEAQANLLNPSKRLWAEMDWFCGCNEAVLANVRQSIKNKTAINVNELTGLAKLNAILFNFIISSCNNCLDVGFDILEIDKQYSAVTALELMETINECRVQAGMLTVSEEDVRRGLKTKREQIRNLISAKTQNLVEKDYIGLIMTLAEKCIAYEGYEDGVVIADVVDQYELKMQFAIETASDEISKHLKRIESSAWLTKKGIAANVRGLVLRLEAWEKLVRPLQLKATASGITHQESERIGLDARDLCLHLHNEREMTEEAFFLVNALKEIFSEVDDLFEIFASDSNTLSEILKKKLLTEIDEGLEAVGKIVEKWKETDAKEITNPVVKDLIAVVKALDEKIKTVNTEKNNMTALRTALCMSVRNGALYIHNEKNNTALALVIVDMLVAEFSDIEELHKKLSGDRDALSEQLIAKRSSSASKTNSSCHSDTDAARSAETPFAQSPQNPGFFIAWSIAAILLIVIIVGVFSCREQASEVSFSNSVGVGTAVYADVVSIFPAFGIYTEGESYYDSFVCECETSQGSNVWVYISVPEYKRYFDANTPANVGVFYMDEKIFSSSKKIHGKVRKTDTIRSALSIHTGTTTLIDFDSVS